MTPGAATRDAAQYLMAELDKRAAEAGRTIHGPVTILEGTGAFTRTLRLEANTRPR
jgi:hypothetical protein